MPGDQVAFVYGDRPARPRKVNRAVQHILRDVFTAPGFIGLGIVLQALWTLSIPQPYVWLPGTLFIVLASLPTVSGFLGLKSVPEERSIVAGRTAAYLDFADPSHVGKKSGDAAMSDPHSLERPPPRLAVMLIGSQCNSNLCALQPEFKEMGDVFSQMVQELRTAPPEEDVGFLNSEFYMHTANPANNSNMVCMYFRSYEHILRFSQREGGLHWPAWNKYRALQRERPKLGTNIGLWHEIYEVSNAEAIYLNMPRIGLGDVWDSVPTPDGRFVYRNPLVVANGSYTSSDGRMGIKQGEKGSVKGTCPLGRRDTPISQS